jgi:hypothetical protein
LGLYLKRCGAAELDGPWCRVPSGDPPTSVDVGFCLFTPGVVLLLREECVEVRAQIA